MIRNLDDLSCRRHCCSIHPSIDRGVVFVLIAHVAGEERTNKQTNVHRINNSFPFFIIMRIMGCNGFPLYDHDLDSRWTNGLYCVCMCVWVHMSVFFFRSVEITCFSIVLMCHNDASLFLLPDQHDRL
mmetsp:Transcript_2739/g.7627  ORF Transcript_2739/g.7627 Transcript_2739/m.7627 type:complete len:128 (-) Transcript_2739:1554-1937(-)